MSTFLEAGDERRRPDVQRRQLAGGAPGVEHAAAGAHADEQGMDARSAEPFVVGGHDHPGVGSEPLELVGTIEIDGRVVDRR